MDKTTKNEEIDKINADLNLKNYIMKKLVNPGAPLWGYRLGD